MNGIGFNEIIGNDIKGGIKMSNKIYYEIQDGWTKDEYYYLHRYLHRMFFIIKSFPKRLNLLTDQRCPKKQKY